MATTRDLCSESKEILFDRIEGPRMDHRSFSESTNDRTRSLQRSYGNRYGNLNIFDTNWPTYGVFSASFIAIGQWAILDRNWPAFDFF
jgi:hypothetical protein